MAVRPSAVQTTPRADPSRPWSLGAVVAERSIDPRTSLLIVRADAGVGAARDLQRRLLGLRLAGYTTLIVDLVGSEHVADVVLAAELHAMRKLAARDRCLVATALDPDLRGPLERAGISVVEDLANAPASGRAK